MSFSVSASGGRGKRRGSRPPMSDINVTPMVDVMLVLLVIFIVTAPMMTEKMSVDLPKAKGAGGKNSSPNPVTVSINSQGQVEINGNILEAAEVAEKLPKLLENMDKKSLTLKADKKLSYEMVVKVMSVLRNAGVGSVNLAVDGSK